MKNRNFNEKIELLYGKYIWIVDDFRINFNKIKLIYNDHIKNLKPELFVDPIKSKNYTELEKDLFNDKIYLLEKYPNYLIPFQINYGTPSDFIYRSSFIYIISMLEGFNHQLVELLKEYFPQLFFKKKNRAKFCRKSNKTEIKIYYNPRSFNKLFKNQFNITNLKEEFSYFSDWEKYHYIRNLLVHNLGIINNNFINKYKEYENQLNNKIIITRSIFDHLVDVVLEYLRYMNNILKKWYLDKKNIIMIQ